jgi:hypothetical protein
MQNVQHPFTNTSELIEYLELSKVLTQRSQDLLRDIEAIKDDNLKDEVWIHLENSLGILAEGLNNAVLSIQGRLLK